MNEEALQEEFEEEEQQEEEQQEEEQQEELEPEPDEDPDLAAARNAGWVPLEEWTESGHNPDEWKGYKAFIKDGELYGALKSQSAEIRNLKDTMGESLKRNNMFYKAQIDGLKADREALEQKLEEAVDLADKDAVKEIRGELKRVEGAIDDMETEPDQPQVNLAQELASHPKIAEWKEQNPWINDGSPRAQKAATAFAERFQGRAKDFATLDALIDDVLDHVSTATKPERNPNRDKNPETAGGGKANAGKSGKLTMKDLTAEERAVWNEFKDEWKESDFLKTVEESRA